MTFFVSLSDYKPASANALCRLLQDWLAAQWAARYPELPGLDVLLRQRRLTLLLDALNEIPVAGAEPVQQWKEFLRQLERDFAGNRVVFSCRHLDYSVTLSSKELPVPQVRIEPLSDAQVQEFLTLYCPEHRRDAVAEPPGHPATWTSCVPRTTSNCWWRRPPQGKFRLAGRALFTGFVRQALRREVESDNALFQPDALLHVRDVQRLVQGRTWPPYELPERGILFQKLSALAFQMQSPAGGERGGPGAHPL